MEIQWYPGHMTKSIRQMQEDCKLIDLVIELADARIPRSSRNPDIASLAAGKARMVLLNKADLADPKVSELWLAELQKEGVYPVLTDARNNRTLKALTPHIQKACAAKLERDKKRGMKPRPIRAMVAGIPNVGKSTFINSFAGSAVAKTGNKPGVTRGKQWIRLNKQVELLDTPGILWPKFEHPETGRHIAMIGSVRDEILNREELAALLIGELNSLYPEALSARYGELTGERDIDILIGIAKKRGCLKKGGEPDTEKAADILLDDFRAGTLGRITLERPDDAAEEESK